MTDGYTKIYLDAEDNESIKELKSSLESLGITNTDTQKSNDKSFNIISFEHQGKYDEKKMTKIIKDRITVSPSIFIRARHYDEYGTEIYWLNYNGKAL